MSPSIDQPIERETTLFPAISSLRARASVLDHLEVLKAIDFGAVLISAYDVAYASDQEGRQILTLIESCQDSGQLVMLDSGGYEAFWRGDSDWSPERYRDIVGMVTGTINLGFDYPQPEGSDDVRTLVEHAIRGAEVARTSGAHEVIPIVHASRDLEAVALEVCSSTGLSKIAVPEKKLGNGILDRSQRIKSLKSELGSKVSLHVLGAGNPLDIGVYAEAGAKSFDGLEWARCYIDPQTMRCHNAAYWQVLDSASWEQTDELGWFFALAVNNLVGLKAWMNSVLAAINRGALAELLVDHFPELSDGR